MSMFDDLIPPAARQGGAPLRVTVRPQDAQPQAGAGIFDDLIPRQPAKASATGDQSTLGNVAQTFSDSGFGVGQGITLGFGDEIVAGALTPIEALTSGEFTGSYERALEKVRGLNKQVQERSPVAFGTGQLVGATAIPLGGAAQGATIGGRIARGAGIGGGFGAVQGAGEGETLGERVSGALTGGATGAALGGVAAPVVEGVARGVGAVLAPVARGVRGALNPENEAARRVGQAIVRDAQADPAAATRLTPQEFNANVQGGGPAVIMDMGGETTRALARSAANTSPEGRGALGRTINDRFEGQSGRVAAWMRNTFGAQTADDLDNAIQQAARNVNRPLYQRAIAQGRGGIWNDELSEMSQAPAMQDAVRAALRQAQNRSAPDASQGRQAVQARWYSSNGTPTLEFWDLVKRQLDQEINVARRAGRNVDVSELTSIKDRLVQNLDAAVPSYQTARATAAGFFNAQNALEAGQNFVMQNFANREARRALARMTPEERELFQRGFVDRFVETLERTGDRRSVLNQVANTPAAREKLEIALGPQRARELEAVLRVEGIMDMARNAIQGNSTTARQLAELGLAGGAGTVGAFGTYNLDPTQMSVAALTGALLAGRRHIDQRLAQRVARMLVSQDPQVIQRGINLVARNTRFMDALRAIDVKLGAVTAVPLSSNRAEGDKVQ